MYLSALLEPVAAALAGAGAPTPRGALRIGVGDAAKPAVAAALAREAPGAVLVVVAREAHARDLFEELSAWLGEVARGRLRLSPQRHVPPYERSPDAPWDVRTRLETIAALHGAGRPIVVASVEAGAQRPLSPPAARAAVWSIAVGEGSGPDDLLRRLQAAGYEVVPLVEAPGQAARRGGIVASFPPPGEAPAPLECFGRAGARGPRPAGRPPAQANWHDLQPKLEPLRVVELSRFATEEAGALRPPFVPAPAFGGRIRVLARDLSQSLRRGEAAVIVSQQASRLVTLLGDGGGGGPARTA